MVVAPAPDSLVVVVGVDGTVVVVVDPGGSVVVVVVVVVVGGSMGPSQSTTPEKFHVLVVFGGNSKPGCGVAVTVISTGLPSPAGGVTVDSV